MNKRILVTGMSGLIGGIVGRSLAKRYEVYALNRRNVMGFPCFEADLQDFEALCSAVKGMHTVVHMAACVEENEVRDLLGANVVGTYNLFEASNRAGVKRIVFGSSGATVMGYETEEPYAAMVEARYSDVPTVRSEITHLSTPYPTTVYGCTKLWGENLGRYYAKVHGMSVLCIRLGRVVAEDRPRDARHAAVYLSHRDATQIVEKCVDAPEDLQFDIFYAVSNNRMRFRDLEHSRKQIGYLPEDGIWDWPEAKH